jgi:hypothetical protein
MPGDSSGDVRRHLITAASAVGLGALATGAVAAATQNGEPFQRSRRVVGGEPAAQDDEALPRSKRISEEVVVSSSLARAADYNEAKNPSLIQVIEHIFKEDEDTSAGFPVKRFKEFQVKPATKLAIVTISGFEIWFGTKEQEYMFAKSREGVNAALEADLGRGTLTVRVRANARRANRIDQEWSWRCHVVIQCFGEG